MGSWTSCPSSCGEPVRLHTRPTTELRIQSMCCASKHMHAVGHTQGLALKAHLTDCTVLTTPPRPAGGRQTHQRATQQATPQATWQPCTATCWCSQSWSRCVSTHCSGRRSAAGSHPFYGKELISNRSPHLRMHAVCTPAQLDSALLVPWCCRPLSLQEAGIELDQPNAAGFTIRQIVQQQQQQPHQAGDGAGTAGSRSDASSPSDSYDSQDMAAAAAVATAHAAASVRAAAGHRGVGLVQGEQDDWMDKLAYEMSYDDGGGFQGCERGSCAAHAKAGRQAGRKDGSFPPGLPA